MESKVTDFTFCLGDNLDKYYLGTYKIGSTSLESSADKFFHFIQYKDNSFSDSFDDLRNIKGNASQCQNILQDNNINILVRPPLDRLVSGLIQEICSFENKKYKGLDTLSTNNKIINFFLSNYFFVYLGKNYTEFNPDWSHINSMVPHLTYFFKQDVFKHELHKWFLQVIGVYSEELLQSKHCAPFYEPLYYFIQSNNINYYQTTPVEQVEWRFNNPHTNSLFKPSLISALNKTNAFNQYLDRENYYYSWFIDNKSLSL